MLWQFTLYLVIIWLLNLERPMKARLTTAKIDKLEPSEKQYLVWDEKYKGLGILVSPKGSKSFVYQGRIGTKQKRITIGKYPLISYQDAIEKASEISKQMTAGIDPNRQKAEEQQKNIDFNHQKQLNAILFEQVLDEYIDENKKNWSERHLLDHYSIKRTLFTPLLNIPLREINQETIIQWQNDEQHRPGRASLAFRLFRACINWCTEHPTYQHLTNKDIHSQKRVRKVIPKLKPRKQTLEKNQLKDWFEAVNSLDNILHKTFLIITLLTGARSESLRSLEWSHVDLQWNSLKIWDKIDQDYRTIPLTHYTKHLLLKLPKNTQNDFVFWSHTSKSGYIEDVRKAYYQALDDHQLPHFTIHDLRRSFSNLSEWLDIPAGVIAQIMGHKPSATAEKHYKNRPVELLKIHHQRLENWILQQADIDYGVLEQ